MIDGEGVCELNIEVGKKIGKGWSGIGDESCIDCSGFVKNYEIG